jgi:predicted amidohydrolase
MSPDPRLAVIQLDTIAREVNHNVHKAMNWTRQAFLEGADYVFLHEGLTADYTPEPLLYGRPVEGTEVYGFQSLAAQHGGYVAVGLNEVYQNRPYISMVWVGLEGLIGVYRKSYLWPNVSQYGPGDFSDWVADYHPVKAGYRQERGVLSAGDGTVVMQVGELRIGCIICADGSREEAWDTFKADRPDLIFWQNNRGNLAADEQVPRRAKEIGAPVVASNRVGFSYHHFQAGGSICVADDGSTVAKANEEGREETIFASYSDLRRA